MKPFYGKNIHVIGVAGTEGAAMLKYLRAKFPKLRITAHEWSTEKIFLKNFKDSHFGIPVKDAIEQGKELLLLPNVQYNFHENYLMGVNDADTIFVPQSWYLYEWNNPLKPYQKKFRAITRLYFETFPGKIIGVTGSFGKTTTTTIIGAIMKRAFSSTIISGNDRRTDQALLAMDAATKDDWMVLEISNRQLKVDLGKSPQISVITNILPNHLLEHRDFKDYAETKASILKYQKKNQWSVLNQDDPESRNLIEIDGGETFPFAAREALPKGVFVEFGKIVIKHGDMKEEVLAVSDIPLKGTHNLSNVLAAVGACYLAHVPLEVIAETIRSIDSIPQREELVAIKDGVEYYNDTASTAPHATIAAIETLKNAHHRLILIMGGRSKGLEYDALAKKIITDVNELILLKSPLSEEMQKLLGSKKKSILCENLKTAVKLAHKTANRGDRVVLSPAGEFFVYFKKTMPDFKRFRFFVTSLPQST